jgi:integrase
MKAKKLPSGNYRVQVVVGHDANGKRIVKSFTAEEEWIALKMAKEYVEEIKNIADINSTVADAMRRYIKTRSNVIEETTVRNYDQILKYRFKSIMDMKICDLQPIQIQQAINSDMETVGAKTVRNAYGLLKSVLNMYGYNKNLSIIRLPKWQPKEKELPSFETLFAVVKGTSVELGVLLAAWISLRIGEVVALKFSDIDKETHAIKVRRTIIQTEEGMKVRNSCKTKDSKRNLELPDYIFDMIMAIPHQSENEFLIQLTRKALYSRFKRLVEKNGIDMTFHDLRHLNASIMLILGVPDKYAMERGGWSTDYVLKTVYQQTFSSERKKIDKMVDGYFNGIINSSESTETV